MTVSSEIENRLEVSNSTAERIACEPVLTQSPWVEADRIGLS